MRKAKSSAAPLHNFCGLVHISEELFPAAVQGLDFAAGEQVEAGEFTVTIPKGLHYTRTENPETRLFTAIPREIPFDAEDFWAYSAVALTLQTGAPIVNIHAPLDTADGEKEVELILQSLSISDSSSAGQTAAGKTTRAARSPDHYICYELIDDNDVDINFRYYVFTKSFLYVGQYVAKRRAWARTAARPTPAFWRPISRASGTPAAGRSCWKTPATGPWAAMPGPTGAWTR